MSVVLPDPARAFRGLQHALVRRRFALVELRLKIEFVALALLVWSFLFWQARLSLYSLARDHGARGVAIALLAVWLGLALAGGALAAARLWRQLGRGPAGPAWLALPLAPKVILRHLAWEARLQTLWGVALAPPFLIAAVGLVPGWWLPLFAAALLWFALEAARAGCAIAWRLAARAVAPRPGVPPVALLLATAARRAPRIVRRRAHWIRPGVRRALWRKDLLVAWRAPAVRRRLLVAVGAGVLSVLAWLLRFELPVPHAEALAIARVVAFALALYAAATFGEFLIALSAEDPFTLLRALPISVRSMWTVRAALVGAGALALVLAHFLAIWHALSPAALHLYLGWTAAAALMIGVLAVNYGLTLFPRAPAAHRMFTLSLGLAMAASFMLPLSGWIVLATAVAHSARRLPRWERLEDLA